ncbi:hypothetical protein CDV36_006451 [Fusarium kuroshium]|uniref:Uncharacterized protein n=1 Tax=Fusarium kuroshium TaxID=2010991 RepID=A0A3M2S8J5_9HYPO|nr:hypothetical protein CDV36_006451 [Fusarium kuroshium]
MDDRNKPIFSEGKQRMLQRHLNRARKGAKKGAAKQEGAANAQRGREDAQRQADDERKRISREASQNAAARKDEAPKNNQNKPTSRPSSSSRRPFTRQPPPSTNPRQSSPTRNDETRYTLPTDAGNHGPPRPPRPPVPRPMCNPDSPPPSPTWGQLGTVAGCRFARFLFSIVDAIFSMIKTTCSALSLRGLLQVWDLALQTGRLVFVLLAILIASLTLSQIFPVSFSQALTTCSKTSLPILAPVCGAIKVALPEVIQDQSDDPSEGDHESLVLAVNARLLGQIAVNVQRDVAYAITSTASMSTEGLEELDSALDDATLSISRQLHNLHHQLNQLLISSSRKQGWGSTIRQFFYIEETNLNRVLRRLDAVHGICDEAQKDRLKIRGQLITGAVSVEELHDMVCLWNNQLNQYSPPREVNLERLQERLNYHPSPQWFWSHLGRGPSEDPEALQGEIDAQENQLRVLRDAGLRTDYGCAGSNIVIMGIDKIKEAIKIDGNELGDIKKKITDIANRLRRDGDWKMAEQELINILDSYFQKIKRLYSVDR